MPETEQNKEDEKQKPSGVVEEGDIGHHGNRNKEYDPALPSKKSIGDMTTIQLSNRQEIEGGHKKAHPPRISNRMEKDIMIWGDLAHHQALNHGE